MLQTTEVPREVGLRLNASQPTTWLFLSNETNSWGQIRSYAIVPVGRSSLTSGRQQFNRSRPSGVRVQLYNHDHME
jgi:hypothetical protein